ncbi:uncharacterized protein [Macrobrachium rosenbergii]|uniref:uncharacterized protein n=1 Tax=Macrobrachium rosenbergii TaxID=79674 RepID=UPI0034D5EAEB
MHEHHTIVNAKMRGEYFGHIRRSTTLFPQRMCNSPPSKRDLSFESENFHLESNSDPLKNESDKENETRLLKKCQQTRVTVKTEISEGIGSYVSVPTETELILCFVCDREIAYEYLSEHLLVGHVKCMRCSVVFTSCKCFQEWTVERDIGMSVCNHLLQYLGDPWEILNVCHAKEISSDSSPCFTGEVENKVHAYLELIKSLRNRYPWKELFSSEQKSRPKSLEVPKENVESVDLDSSCNVQDETTAVNSDENSRDFSGGHVSEEHATVETDVYEFSETVSETGAVNCSSKSLTLSTPEKKMTQDNVKSNDLQKSTKGELTRNCLYSEKGYQGLKMSSDHLLKVKKRRAGLDHNKPKRKVLVSQTRKSTKFIDTPSDGFYYIAKDSVKECPNCYTLIRPEDFAVNIVTFLMTAICSDCGLTIYIVENQSDDSGCPRVRIVTD